MYFLRQLPKIKICILLLFTFFCNHTISAQEENLHDSIKSRFLRIKPTPESSVNFGGALWLRSVNIPYLQDTEANQRGFYIDQLRFSIDGDYGIDEKTKLNFSTQVRFFQYQTMIHHMWIGVDWNKYHTLKLGVSQVPFGTLPGSTNSFWYSLGYYVGLEDDRDSGIKYNYNHNGWDVTFAYFMNAEFNNASALNRFAPDLVTSGDQQNEIRRFGT